MNLNEYRLQKDIFMESHPQSPLTPEQKQNFESLDYYPENVHLIFELDLELFERQDSITMQTSTGDLQTYNRVGKIQFKINSEIASLTVFENAHGYFLPFVDTNAGKTTYGAGRYLEPELLNNGKLMVNFNLAYNPYCAYNGNYSCPIPPAENKLEIAIEAGEKIFPY